MSHFADRKYFGIFFACASYGIYSLHFATVKWLTAEHSLWQLVFMRSVVMCLITLAVSGRGTVSAAINSPYRLSTLFRGVLQFVAMACFFLAARDMSLSAVMTLYCTAPLIIVVLSIFILGESVHGYRWLAVMVGVSGSVIAANPGGAINPAPALLALSSAFFWALAVIFTRKNSATDSTPVQLLVTGVVFIVLSGALMTWETPSTLLQWGLMVALGLQIYLAQYFFFEACRFAPASLVGPLEYTSVGWSCLLGYLIFSDIPTPHIIIGAVLVSASGIVLAMSARGKASERAA
ncbi:DMT family transporter [Pseudomonas sp. NA-150]|uniref:DMT family transporter n=1 Tax=Pseudomonas sp. NA-150 TaxID=3367525 RepID=UPI0037CC20A7